jgi:hypothetical protein
VILVELYNPRLDPADWGCRELAREIELNTWRAIQDWTLQTAPAKIKELGFGDRRRICLRRKQPRRITRFRSSLLLDLRPIWFSGGNSRNCPQRTICCLGSD